MLVGKTRLRSLKHGPPAGKLTRRALCRSQRIPRYGNPALRLAYSLTGLTLTLHLLAHGIFRLCEGCRRFFKTIAGFNRFGFKFRQTVLLGKPHGSRGGRIRTCAITIPAPQRAIARNKPLPRLQLRLQALTVRSLDYTDLRQTPCQLLRCRCNGRKRPDALRQDRLIVMRSNRAPMDRRSRISWNINVFAKGGTK